MTMQSRNPVKRPGKPVINILDEAHQREEQAKNDVGVSLTQASERVKINRPNWYQPYDAKAPQNTRYSDLSPSEENFHLLAELNEKGIGIPPLMGGDITTENENLKRLLQSKTPEFKDFQRKNASENAIFMTNALFPVAALGGAAVSTVARPLAERAGAPPWAVEATDIAAQVTTGVLVGANRIKVASKLGDLEALSPSSMAGPQRLGMTRSLDDVIVDYAAKGGEPGFIRSAHRAGTEELDRPFRKVGGPLSGKGHMAKAIHEVKTAGIQHRLAPASPVATKLINKLKEVGKATDEQVAAAAEEEKGRIARAAAEFEQELPKQEELVKQAKESINKAIKSYEQGETSEIVGLEVAFKKAFGHLRGEYVKPTFSRLRDELTQDEIQGLLKEITYARTANGNLLRQTRFYDFLNTETAFQKVLNGQLPTKSEIALLTKMWGKEMGETVLTKRSLGRKAWENFVAATNFPRSVLSSYDLSAPLRQGIVLATGHPKEFVNSFYWMSKAFVSEGAAEAVETQIKNGRNYKEFSDAGLFLAGRGGKEAVDITLREEAFMSKWAHIIPGIKQSERAYVTFLNKLRYDTMENVVQGWRRGGGTETWRSRGLAGKIPGVKAHESFGSEQDIRELALFLNRATGRGGLGPLEGSAPILNAVFFSPRLQAGRLAMPLSLVSKSRAVRQQTARDLALFIGTGIGILSLVKMSGQADVETDPRSTDFGRIKFKDSGQRLDFWGGYQPIVRFASQLIAGRKSLNTGDLKTLTWDERGEATWRFIRSKFGPPAAATHDILSGESIIGEEVSLHGASGVKQLKERLVPLFVQDMWEAIEEEGLMGGYRALPAFFGASVMTFHTTRDAVNHILANEVNMTTEEGRRILDLADSEMTQVQRAQIMNRPDVQELLRNQQRFANTEQRNKSQHSVPERNLRAESRDKLLKGWDGIAPGKLMAGDEWRKNLSLEAMIAGALSELRQDLQGEYPDRKPKNDNEEALFEYYHLIDSHKNRNIDIGAMRAKLDAGELSAEQIENLGQDFDIEGFAEAAEIFMGNLTEKQREYVLNNTHPNRTPTQHVYYESQKVLKEYWELPDAVVEGLTKKYGREDAEAMRELHDVWVELPGNEKKAFAINHPSVKGFARLLNARQNRLRRTNRALDDALILFYSRVPTHPGNVRESKSGMNIQVIRDRVLEGAEEKLAKVTRITEI